MKLFLVAVGGGTGAVLRWLLSTWAQRMAGDPVLPLGTLVVNVLGCVAIGALAAWLTAAAAGEEPEAMGRYALRLTEQQNLFLFVGLLGGFTTFSSFALDALALTEASERAWALGYIAATNVLGIAGAWVSYWGVERAIGAHG